jgi:hypothetical protein
MPRPAASARHNAAEKYVRPAVSNREIKSNLGPVRLSALTRKNNASALERAYNTNNNNNNSVVLQEHPAVSAARAYEEEADLLNMEEYGGASFAQRYENAHSKPATAASPSAQVPGGLNLFKSSALQKLKARATRGHKAALTAYNESGVNVGASGVSAPLPSVVAVSRGASSDPSGAVSGQKGGKRKTHRRRRYIRR